MLLRRSCSPKFIDFFHKSKVVYTIHRSKSSTSTVVDSCNVPYHETLTLLRKTIKLLPRALPSPTQGNLSPLTESFEFWRDILEGAFDDLTLVGDRPARIAVCGFDEFSGAQDLVTALLEEPLSSDQGQNERVRSRWKDRTETRSLVITSSASSRPSTFVTQSAYLCQFPVPVDITEVPSITHSLPRDGSSGFTIDNFAAQTLLQADAVVLVCNPLTIPLLTLFRTPLLTKNPNTILILSFTSTPPPELIRIVSTQFVHPTTFHEPTNQGREILFVDPGRALSANKIFTSNPRSPVHVQKYQDEYTSSNISSLTTSLKTILSTNSKPLGGSLQNQTALGQLRSAIYTCRLALTKARDEVEDICMAVDKFNEQMEEAMDKARGDVLGQLNQAKTSGAGDIVSVALKDAKQEIGRVMDHLTWWRMASRVDEISTIVSQTLQRSWCQNLEKQLTMQAGRLSALQSNITSSTFSLLSQHTTSPFKSAVLDNTLNQLKTSQHYHIGPQTLTGPISSRSAQIIQYPTMSLHVAGQRAVLGMVGGVAGSVGLGWAGWLGWLVGSGEGLLGTVGMDAGTAMGAGLLGATAAVRWAVGTWERSKRRWWEDCSRVSDGLDRDLRDTLDKVLQEKVLVVGRVCCSKLRETVIKRREESELIEADLRILYKELQCLERQFPTTPYDDSSTRS